MKMALKILGLLSIATKKKKFGILLENKTIENLELQKNVSYKNKIYSIDVWK